MSKTKRADDLKNAKAWAELQEEKRAFVERMAEEKEAKKALRDFLLHKKLEEMYPDDPPF